MTTNNMPELDPATRAGLTSIISGLEGLIERDAAETIADVTQTLTTTPHLAIYIAFALNDARLVDGWGTATIPDTRLNRSWLCHHRAAPKNRDYTYWRTDNHALDQYQDTVHGEWEGE